MCGREDRSGPDAPPAWGAARASPAYGRFAPVNARLPPILLSLALCATSLPAQTYVGIGADFGAVARRGTWSETYGPALVTGFRIEGGTPKGWLLDLQGELLYGNDVRVDPIAALRTEVGLLGDELDAGAPVDVPLRARGFRLGILVGYQRNFPRQPFGWRLLTGPAYTGHNIRIQDDATLQTSNLSDDVKRGYDRRAGGFGGYAEAGLFYARDNRNFIAFVSATANVFASEPLRSVQFDLRRAAPAAGTDTALGLKLGFVTALFRPSSLEEAEDIYY